MFKLIRGGAVYTPEEIGVCDILLCCGKIIKIGENIVPPQNLDVEIIEANGKKVVPGFVDGHIHILGAGGGAGPDSRSGLVHLSTFARAGVTSAIGTLGVDCVGYRLEELLIRARALEFEGISTYMLCGSFMTPSATLTGSIMKDFSLIDKVVGVKIAMRETLKNSPPIEMLAQIIQETWLGGRMSDKAGVVVSHIGDAKGSLAEVSDLLDVMAIPQRAFVATHVNRSSEVLADAICCGKRGLIMDLTGNVPRHEKIAPSKALRMILNQGVPLDNVTFSSDSGAAYEFDGVRGILPVDVCAKEIRAMVLAEGLSLSTALATVTTNPARVYRLDATKGSLTVGKDADILLLDDDYRVDTVLAKGKLLVCEGRPVVRGRLEEPLLEILR
ncbi:isoaspartyl dipeptidase [Synergistales bacterium]|nr:isoaspartyl dipeptidase [Synergistales bacterium]